VWVSAGTGRSWPTTGPDLAFSQRYSALRERVSALRAAWGDEEASFEGRWDRFSPSWVYPKPGGGRVPIALGNSGPLGLRHAAEYADHWCPINTMLLGADGRPDVEGGITRFRALAAEAGRDPATIGISLLMFTRPTEARLERYATLGLDRVVLTSTSASIEPAADTLRLLDQLTPLVEAWRSR
jgi:alkanesulfonate monooxygenase SsuD/methylene tetrahydromethanopterin reductase-like flavin-dependent oxidoreductase (luciferase family)